MSSTEKMSNSAPLIIRNDNYVFDKNLKICPSGWECPREDEEFCLPPPTKFPSLKIFANLAFIAYGDYKDVKCKSKDELEKEGFTFLSVARNTETLNGYCGVAYVHREKGQVVLSHRGTKLSTVGAVFADLNGILRKKLVPQVTSAISFAHKVVNYAEKRGYQVFFTGHSLGGWLAQITTFSAMYLTFDEGHFVGKQSPFSHIRMPYTVVFDSPGAYEFLFSLKKAVFPRHVESTQEIDVETLPVEVYLFHPNPINCVNFQIGSVFMLDVVKVGVDTSKYFGTGTHGIGPVLKLLSDLEEDNAVKWKVIDYRVGKMEVSKNSWNGKDQTVPCDRRNVPLYFFSREERRFLTGANRDFPPEGQFEGVTLADEESANEMVKVEEGEFYWRLTGGEELVICSGGRDKRDFIPRVRYIVRCLRKYGTLWWNPRKSQLTPNYLDRRMKLTEDASSIRTCSGAEVLKEETRLVLFVDPPGMGKSSVMTKLEMELRSEVSSLGRVIVRLNLNQFQDILESQQQDEIPLNGSGEDAKRESRSIVKFLERFVKYIPVDLLQQSLNLEPYSLRFPLTMNPLPLYVLLDGLDEVCPLYEQITLRILQNLLSDTPQGVFSVHKVILTTRQHLQKLVEDHFSVKGHSLVPLKLKQQEDFLQKQFGPSNDAQKSLRSLPSSMRSLMGNPLMLSLYCQVVKSRGAGSLVNLFDLYSQFMETKHKLHVVEKEEMELAKQSTKQRLASMLEDNLKFYYACAVNELIGSIKTKKPLAWNIWKKRSDLGEEWLELPVGRKLEELISFGVLVSNAEGSEGRFKHRSFAEFFYAKLLTDETNQLKNLKKLRIVLLKKLYEKDVAENVEKFVREILLERQTIRKGNPFPASTNFCRLNRILTEDEASLYLGKCRLDRLAKGWLDSLKDKRTGLINLLENKYNPDQQGEGKYSSGYDFNTRRLSNIRGVFAGTTNKHRSLTNFYNGNLFCFLCGWTLFMSLDYSDPEILRILKNDIRHTGNFSSWLCILKDRNWVRRKVFNLKVESAAETVSNLVSQMDLAELITMITVRSDEICRFLSHVEISSVLNSLDFVVYEALTINDVEKMRVRSTLEKYVEPQRLKHSLVLLLKNTSPFEWKTILLNLEMSWWYAEVFSKKELLSILTDEATRVTDVVFKFPTKVMWAWGTEFLPRWEDVLKFRRNAVQYKRETIFEIDGHEWEMILYTEIQKGGIESHLGLNILNVLREAFARDPFGWKILKRLETVVELHGHVGNDLNRCFREQSNPLANILEQLFSSKEYVAAIINNLELKKPSLGESFKEDALWEWLPFVIRYSGRIDHVTLILKRLSLLTQRLSLNCLQSAAVSFVLAHCCDKIASREVLLLIRAFIRGLQIPRGSLLNILLEADEGELRTIINEISPGSRPAKVINTPIWGILISLMLKKNSPWNLNEKIVGNIFIGLIETSPTCEFLGVLKQFQTLFSPDLLKAALLSNKVLCFMADPARDLDIYVYYNPVDTKIACNKVDAFRLYFYVFGEDMSWTTQYGDTFNYCLLETVPVEILSVLENLGPTHEDLFPEISRETKLRLVSKLEEKLRTQLFHGKEVTLCTLTKRFSYKTEVAWERLLQALELINPESPGVTGSRRATWYPFQGYGRRVDSIVALLRVWVKFFGAEETRRAGDEKDLWSWGRLYDDDLNGLVFLQAAVEVGSLKGVKNLAWPGLMRLKNEGGKSIGEVAVEILGGDHEITKYLEERLKAARIFQDET